MASSAGASQCIALTPPGMMMFRSFSRSAISAESAAIKAQVHLDLDNFAREFADVLPPQIDNADAEALVPRCLAGEYHGEGCGPYCGDGGMISWREGEGGGESVTELGIDEASIADELAAMDRVLIAPTNDRSILGSMNEFVLSSRHYAPPEGGWTKDGRLRIQAKRSLGDSVWTASVNGGMGASKRAPLSASSVPYEAGASP